MFYTRQGWTEVGVFPAALRLGPGDMRDEHWFQLRLS
jgi:acetyltransferase